MLTAFGAALKALARSDEAIAAYERGCAQPHQRRRQAQPGGRRLETPILRARRGGGAPGRSPREPQDAGAWLVLGRALVGLGRHTEAEAAYREAIRRRPDYVKAHGALAQIVWMQKEDIKATAVADLDIGNPGPIRACRG